MQDGSLRVVRSTRVVWSVPDLYIGRAKQAGWTDGAVALAEAEADGWQIYNVDVEDFHTYVAEGQIPHDIMPIWSAH